MDEQPLSAAVLADRYARAGETTRAAIFRRVAHALALAEPMASRARVEQLFYRNMQRGAIGAGRIMANAGTGAEGTMVNCFVHPVAMPGVASLAAVHAALAQALDEARITLLMGGGVGYDFSPLPPATAYERRGADTPDVCAAIDRFDIVCRALPYAGPRRGAQMAVLRCDHPDIIEFVEAKHGRRRWPTFSLAVGVTDAFMEAVAGNLPWTLRHRVPPCSPDCTQTALPDGSWTYATVPARALWHVIVNEARDSSEPRLLFLDTIDAADSLRAREHIDATDPCSEQPLPAYGSSVLGPIDLSRFVRHPFGVDGKPQFDFVAFADAVRVQVRMLDNAIDLTVWPLAAHAREAHEKRRIGVGVTGLADALTMLRLRYDCGAARMVAREIALTMRHHAFSASASLAAERGVFPAYDAADYLDGAAHRAPLPVTVRETIARHGLRNSHLMSFAPAGSVSVAFGDNCSHGVEPAIDWVERREVRTGDNHLHAIRAENHAYRLFRQLHGEHASLPDYFVKAADIAPADHVSMLAALQPCVDAAISKTVNVDRRCSLAQIDALFFAAWRERLKSIRIFRPDPTFPSVFPGGAFGQMDAHPC
ncbi:adenosylcobalamin-dependent ribonucleoside-diphosphate reductase [Burkholderia ubonensis]|uniref:Vitamin B12-dependent ribonucleotide reductase n=1 Tax=Burkholderia ubonensis TaxID=101571 RepID=A0A107FNX3_9BURK|nr:adenosylcobalamin-dependent ribonucleoside-diphosphate reductase [Burkholderia ubonensis]KWD74131.1 ribonucleotide reductase-like protein [Burkholderia ubonensis]KWD83618.1 ribonucleotide reductase-like protein [Burkholderia ubonensis]KWD96992.1 ribonucleotide reductase-like protein [Burkholderia ubonensis]KWE13514.1 ribonucleotide reductase-like protein [Burkholderia ubonensis]KWN14989.1 ribonucleotide reductase-like protein [Burkholderia ubonensis]